MESKFTPRLKDLNDRIAKVREKQEDATKSFNDNMTKFEEMVDNDHVIISEGKDIINKCLVMKAKTPVEILDAIISSANNLKNSESIRKDIIAEYEEINAKIMKESKQVQDELNALLRGE